LVSVISDNCEADHLTQSQPQQRGHRLDAVRIGIETESTSA
jgi:hypothetical protein